MAFLSETAVFGNLAFSSKFAIKYRKKFYEQISKISPSHLREIETILAESSIVIDLDNWISYDSFRHLSIKLLRRSNMIAYIKTRRSLIGDNSTVIKFSIKKCMEENASDIFYFSQYM